MRLGWRIAALAGALLFAAGFNVCFDTVLNARWRVAYVESGNTHGYLSDRPVGFVQTMGWPFKSYEFVEGKLDFLKSPYRGFRLQDISRGQYVAIYDGQYDTSMTGARGKWLLPGLCANGAVALALAVLVSAPALLFAWRRPAKS